MQSVNFISEYSKNILFPNSCNKFINFPINSETFGWYESHKIFIVIENFISKMSHLTWEWHLCGISETNFIKNKCSDFSVNSCKNLQNIGKSHPAAFALTFEKYSGWY